MVGNPEDRVSRDEAYNDPPLGFKQYVHSLDPLALNFRKKNGLKKWNSK